MGFFNNLFKPVQNIVNPDDEEKKRRKNFQDSVSRLFGDVSSGVGKTVSNVGKTLADINRIDTTPLNRPNAPKISTFQEVRDVGEAIKETPKNVANLYTQPIIGTSLTLHNIVSKNKIKELNLPYLGPQRSLGAQVEENKFGQKGAVGNILGYGLTGLNLIPAADLVERGLKAVPKTEISKVLSEIEKSTSESRTLLSNEAGFAKIPGKVAKAKPKTPALDITAITPKTKYTKGKLSIETGRLNVNNLDLKTPQRRLIQTLEQDIKPMEKITDKQLLDAAKKSGYNMETHTADSIRKEAVQEVNLRRSIVEDTLSHQVLLDSGAPLEETVQNVSGLVEKIQASASQGKRASTLLHARSILADEMSTPMEKILRLMDQAHVNWNDKNLLESIAKTDFNDAKQVLTLYRTYVKASFWDWVDLLRYNSMLSSPRTQIVNIAANLQSGFFTPARKVVEGGNDWLATAFSKVNPLMKTRARTRFAGEGAVYAKDYWSNVGTGLKKIFSSFKEGDLYPDTGGKYNVPLTSAKSSALAKGTEATLRAPMNLMEGMDQFFTTLGTAGERGALKYRVSKGVEVANLEEKARAAATYSVFRADLGNKSQGYLLRALDEGANTLYHWRNSSNPLVSSLTKFTFPFIRTGTNLMKQGIEYSPAGLATIPGASDKIAQASKAFMGAGITAGLWMLADSNRLTWSTPTDPKKAQAFKDAHLQPYSIKLGDHWFSYSKLHPAFAFNLALVSAIKTSWDNKKIDDNTLEVFGDSMAKSLQFWADQTYFKSVGDLVSAAQGTPSGISKLVANYPAQLIPFRALLSYVNQLTDPYQRQVDKDGNALTKQIQSVLSQLPVFSQWVPIRKNALGEPIKNDASFSSDTGLINAVSPVRVTKEVPGPREFYDQLLKKSQINSISKSFDSEVQKELSKQMAPYLKELQNTPDYVSASEADKDKIISRIESKLKIGIRYDIYSANANTIVDSIQKDLANAKSSSDKLNIILTYKSNQLFTDSVLSELEKRGVDLNF